jgi:steroid 5-alpha reductase family enzyme
MGMAVVAWLASIALRDLRVADGVRPLCFPVMAAQYLVRTPEHTTRSLLTSFLVTLWASRPCA